MSTWRRVTPADIVDGDKSALVIGPFGSNLKSSDFTPSGVPLIFVRDIRAGDFSSPRAYVSPSKAEELRAHIALPGDVLVTKMGDPPGDACIYAGKSPAVITADCIRLRPSPQFDSKFIVYALGSPSVRRQILSISSGAAQQKVSLERFRTGIEVFAPFLNEQRRIAAILDLADGLRVKRRRVLAHIDSLTQSIFHDMFGGPDVATVELGELCSFYSGGTPSKKTQDYWVGDLPWFSPKDLKVEDLLDSQDHISRKVPAETNLRQLPIGTVVLVVRGMILAHTVPVSILRVPGTINQDIKAVLPLESLDVDFLAAALRARSKWTLARITTAAHGTRKLESSVLEAIPIPHVSSGRQGEFAARVAQVRTQREAIQRALEVDDELFASLQARAFRGEL